MTMKADKITQHLQEAYQFLSQCTADGCSKVCQSPTECENHIKGMHKFSFHDQSVANTYIKKIQEINYNSMTPLPTVAPYWREQGKSTPEINDENVALPVTEITTRTPALQYITNNIPLQDDTSSELRCYK